MGRYIKQDQTRSRLQEQIAADLRAKAAQRSAADSQQYDGVRDSRYIEGSKQTTTLSWAWAAIAFLAFAILAYLAYMAFTSTNQVQ